MYILIAVLCFINGASLAACFFIAHRCGRRRTDSADKTARPEQRRLMAQLENFLNYDGSERGQREIDG